MVRIVEGVACCVPLGAQRATNQPDAHQGAQHPAQRSQAVPYETEGQSAQQLAQQVRNTRNECATNVVPEAGQLLRTGGAVAAAVARRNRALALLVGDPAQRVAVVVEAGDTAVVGVAIRGVAYGELEIPADRYDPAALLALMDRHAPQLSSNIY